jgi:hypothetical protein
MLKSFQFILQKPPKQSSLIADNSKGTDLGQEGRDVIDSATVSALREAL